VLRFSLPTPSTISSIRTRVIASVAGMSAAISGRNRCAHPGYMLQAGSPKQREIDHIEPAQDAVDDRPQDRVVVGIGDRDGECRAKTHAVFRALDPNPVISISVH